VRILEGKLHIYLHHSVQTGSEALPVSKGYRGLSIWGYRCNGRKMITHFHLSPTLRMHGDIHPLPHYVFMAWCSIKHSKDFIFTLPSTLKTPKWIFLFNLHIYIYISLAIQWPISLLCSFINKKNRSLAFHGGGSDLISSHVMWDLPWVKLHWGRLSPSTSVSPANSHSTNCSTFINHRIIL
jgi:hypothetical protein